VSVNDKRLDLTPREFQLLEYFLLHPEEVVRRTTLLEKVWDMHFDPESNVVDVHVGNLRRKLADASGEQLLQTVRGVGFSLRRTDELGTGFIRALGAGPAGALPGLALFFITAGLGFRLSTASAWPARSGWRAWRSPGCRWSGARSVA
jgi:hypothetical protein